MTTPTNSIILPSSDSDKQRIKGAMNEISASYTRIDAERDFIKEAIVSLSDDGSKRDPIDTQWRGNGDPIEIK